MSQPRKQEALTQVESAQQVVARIDAQKGRDALRAKADLDWFYVQIEGGTIVPTSTACSANLNWLRGVISTAYPASNDSQARAMVAMAERLEDFSNIFASKLSGYNELAKLLRLEADRVAATAWPCPWESPDVLEQLTSGEKVISSALWRCNRNRGNEWVIPFETFLREVWGDPDTKIETVKSRVSKLRKTLRILGIPLCIEVRPSKNAGRIECRFNSGIR